MAYGAWPGQNGPWRQPGDDGRSLPSQRGYGQRDDTQVPGPSGQRGQRPGGDGLWQPPEWRHGQQQRYEQRPQDRFLATWPAQPGQQGFGPPPQQPPYRPPQPPYQPPQRGKSWPARHKALTGFLAFSAFIIIIAVARSGGPSSPPGNGTTAGLTTTTSPTATQTPSHHATQAAAAARKTQSQKAQPTAPATPHAPAPSAHVAPTTPAAVVAAPPSAAPSPAPPTSAAPASCHPLTNAGNCYKPGEFCRASDHGASGVAGNGEAITCEDNDGWRWEPA